MEKPSLLGIVLKKRRYTNMQTKYLSNLLVGHAHLINSTL